MDALLPKTCVDCSTEKTPRWRHGPAGPRTLCNACGLKYAQQKIGDSASRRKKGRPKQNVVNKGIGTSSDVPEQLSHDVPEQLSEVVNQDDLDLLQQERDRLREERDRLREERDRLLEELAECKQDLEDMEVEMRRMGRTTCYDNLLSVMQFEETNEEKRLGNNMRR